MHSQQPAVELASWQATIYEERRFRFSNDESRVGGGGTGDRGCVFSSGRVDRRKRAQERDRNRDRERQSGRGIEKASRRFSTGGETTAHISGIVRMLLYRKNSIVV